MAKAARATVERPAGPPPVRKAVRDADIIPGSEGVSVEEVVKAAQRMLAVKRAKDELLQFTRLMMPSPDDPDDPALSRYDIQHFHELIAEALEKVERGEILRLIITAPPRHGKSQLSSRAFSAWYMGRNPYNSIILTSYNDKLAQDVGNDVREIIRSPMFGQVFPLCKLRKGSAAVDRMQTTEGGMLVFVGAGGTIAGRGGDVVIIDDPIKGSEEADSAGFREKQWTWFTQDVMSRLMSSLGAIIIIMTRWHEDDIVGRLTDPKNPCYNADEAKTWKILHLTGLAEANDNMGRPVGAALWPERHSQARLQAMRRINPRGFNANYQGRPTPEDGEFFKRDWLKGYKIEELPRNLRMYASSDHAVGQKQEHDKTCLMAAGVDDKDNIWIMPDLFWGRYSTEIIVEKMIDMMELHKPLVWWGENDHIMKSIGPFLRKRMQERKVYCNVENVSAAKDKVSRAQSIRARMSMGMVRFPIFAPWWGDAMDELLKFPRGRHDDFVDPLAHIGKELGRLVGAVNNAESPLAEPRPGTIAWMKWAGGAEKKEKQHLTARNGL